MAIWYDEENTLEDKRDSLPKDLFSDSFGRELPPRDPDPFESDLVNEDSKWDADSIDAYYDEVLHNNREQEDEGVSRFRERWFGR